MDIRTVSRIAAFIVAFAACAAHAKIVTKALDYEVDHRPMHGYLAYDDAVKEQRPGVLVVPEWWGLTDYPKSRAEQLAKLGYVAFVADIYGNGFTTDDPKVAGQKAGEAKQNGWLRSRGKLALEQLRKDEHVDPQNLAAIGYCFGGGCVLELARAGEDLKGVVSFHGDVSTNQPAKQGDVKAKILVCHGAADPLVTNEAVDKFQQEMKDAGADVRIIRYPNAKHAFTNPDADKHNMPPISYNAAADKKSWQDMKQFFAEIFGDANPKPAAAGAAGDESAAPAGAGAK